MPGNDLARQIKEHLTARQVVELYGFHPDRGGYIQCPFHAGDNHGSLKVYDGDKSGWHCFGCGAGGSVIDFVMRLFGLSFAQACLKLNCDFGLGLTGERPSMAERSALLEARRREAQEKEAAAALYREKAAEYQTLPKAYMACTDYAFQQVFTGAADYNTAIRRACSGIVKHGVSVAYASGVHTGLEAAVRRNIMGGLGLMTEQISQQNHDALGCNGWEISAHANSAPDHEPIQGLQYSDAAYEELNNSLVRRIGTLNCGHVASPIILGVTRPQYTAAELEQFRQDNEKGVTFEGRHYTGYEATQMQRRMERAIRAQKRRVLLAGPEDAAPRKSRLVLLQQEYRSFSDGVGLRTEDERLEVSGFGPKQMKQLPLEKPASSTVLTPEVIKPPEPPELPDPPKSPAPPELPKPERFTDITGNWYPDAKPNSHRVLELQEYTFNEVIYKVDGHNVVLDHDAHEKEIAELLEREVGGELYLVPRVNEPQGVPTPDFLFHGARYDLKTLRGNSKNTIYNAVAKQADQADNFILDVTDCPLSEEDIYKQAEALFRSTHTKFIDTVVLVRNMKIIRVLQRNK